MKLIRQASAGTMESSDLIVTVFPAESGIKVDVESSVLAQFGDSIRRSVLELAKELKVEGATIAVDDHGALDCTIRARVETALMRAAEEES